MVEKMVEKTTKEEGSEIIEGKLIERLPQFEEGLEGTIISAEKVTTMARGLRGIRVTIEDKSGAKYAEMLWLRDAFGENSKLGAFVKALGPKLSDWVGKEIVIERWRQRDRKISLATAKKKK